MILPHWKYRDMVHYHKYRFFIPNLKNKDLYESPHGCYRNRGQHKRYMRLMKTHWR